MPTLAIVSTNSQPDNEAEMMKDEAVELYNRGEFHRARELTLQAFNLSSDDLQFICAYNWAMVERAMGNYLTALSIHTLALPMFESSQSNLLKGQFSNGYGLTFRQLGLSHRALHEYQKAAKYFEAACAWSDFKAVENNIAYLLIATGHAKDAVERLKRIKHQFEMLNQFERAAEVEDTLCQAYQAIQK